VTVEKNLGTGKGESKKGEEHHQKMWNIERFRGRKKGKTEV